MCHDFVAQVEVFYFSPVRCIWCRKQKYTIHSQENENECIALHTIPYVFVLLELEILSQNCFKLLFWNTCNSVQVEGNTV